MSEAPRAPRLLVSSLGLMVVSGIGLLFGALREASVAYAYGASWSSDSYFVAVIPVTLVTALGTDMSVAMLPLYVQWQTDKAGALDRFNSAVRRAGWLAVVGVGVAALAAPLWVPAIAPGMPKGEQSEAMHMIWILAPGIALLLPGLLWQSRANAHHRFALPQLATQAPNLGIIIGAFLLSTTFGVLGVAMGQLLGLLLQALVLWRLAGGGKLSESAAASTDPYVRAFFVNWLLAILGALTSKFEPFLQRFYASQLGAGEISSLNYAARVAYLPNVLFTMAVATVAFPRLAEYAASDLAKFRRLLGRLTVVALAFLLVTAVFLFAARHLLVNLLFHYGRFSAADAEMTSGNLAYFAVGVVPLGAVIIFVRCALVLGAARLYALSGVASLAAYWLTAHFLVARLGSSALALANAAAYFSLGLTLGVGIVLIIRQRERARLPG